MTRPDRSKSYAVLIGVSTYEDPAWEDVPGAQNNIEALRELLSGPQGCVAPENCVLLPNPSSPAEILRKILEVGEEATDFFFLYYVGHGFPSETRQLFLTDSGTAQDIRLREASALEWDRLRLALQQNVSAQRKMVVIDSCHSGLAVDHLGSDGPLLDIEGSFILASTHGSDTVPGGKPFTLFTGKLIDLLRTGVTDDSPFLTPWMIYEEVRHRLRHTKLRIPQPFNTGNVGELWLLPNPACTPIGELTMLDLLLRWWHSRQPRPSSSSRRMARPPKPRQQTSPSPKPILSRIARAAEPAEEPVETRAGTTSPVKVGAGGGGVLVAFGVIFLISVFSSSETRYVGELTPQGDAPLNAQNALSFELRADDPNISTIFTLPPGLKYRKISSVSPAVSLKSGCRNVEFDVELQIDQTPYYEAKFANRASGAARLSASTLPTLDRVDFDIPGTGQELRVLASAILEPGCALTLSLDRLKIVESDTEWIVDFVA
ncbi:caspase family protein [Lentzea sp. BCCO 10_0061]|uniref:Caspase family protein n=1 Tax=Lentzea sokolovensis TaxID=3095429 RepID=A0ABU4VCN3_9PSEU|nr:caspase family protein [Lentzea sp. BCCO 10_0061]MDX8149527.1 caspase family protein [Lentzea sp. BCCO 10_0061]